MVGVPEIKVKLVPFTSPVIAAFVTVYVQVYVVFAGTRPSVVCVGETVNATPLQVTLVIGLIAAVGLTVTVKVKGLLDPQKVVVGVTI